MSASKQWVLVRESRAAAGSALRFASEPQSGAECKLLMEQWRDTHNTSLTAGQMKKEGRVVAAPLTGSLAEEWASFRTRFADWTPLAHVALSRLRCTATSWSLCARATSGTQRCLRPASG